MFLFYSPDCRFVSASEAGDDGEEQSCQPCDLSQLHSLQHTHRGTHIITPHPLGSLRKSLSRLFHSVKCVAAGEERSRFTWSHAPIHSRLLPLIEAPPTGKRQHGQPSQTEETEKGVRLQACVLCSSCRPSFYFLGCSNQCCVFQSSPATVEPPSGAIQPCHIREAIRRYNYKHTVGTQQKTLYVCFHCANSNFENKFA